MTETPTAPASADAPTSGTSAFRRLLRNPLGLFSSVVLLLIVLFGLASPFSPHDPNTARLELTNAPPFSGDFVLGGDQAGRDILSRLMHATLGTLTASLVVLAVSLVLGVVTGLVAGYFGGWFDTVSSWVAGAVMALPGFVLLIALYTVIGPSILTAMAVFGVLIAPSFYRLVRGLVISVRQELYVDAAKVSGLSEYRIISRHVLRAVRAPVIIQSSFVLSAGIAIQAGLEFLGLGDPTSASWGGMLQDAFNNLYIARANVIWPAALISLTTLCLVLLGNALRDVLQAGGTQVQPLRASVVTRLRAEHEASGTARPASFAEASADGERATALLTVRDLVVAYPVSGTEVRSVVHGASLDVRRGEIHGLVGESGSGKSQTAFSVLGILPRAAVVLGGEITFDGADLRDPARLREVRGKRIGYVPQEPMSNLDPMFSIGAQLTYGLRAGRPLSRARAKEELLELLARVGIRDPRRIYDSYPHQISGGMAQRVLIAGAVAAGPDLIIADEPTTALDVTVQAGVLELIRELQQERNLSMLLVTHNFGVVADICDRVSVMKEGLVVETNDTEALFRDPRDPYTRMLLASTLDGSVVREPLRLNEGKAAI
ncbi:dipeptide/oligopeptide/nickel ABC transporter permease/ATP-binding protein [Streptomyces sp. NPDC057253]|uniref:dipeptide/oligopeptide/nickel ABC transporter permease/ATP-binding protein n=1 Tax=Streptomyces sp. NPDC057253 TaxID=3346069 RepID=UPI00364060DA